VLIDQRPRDGRSGEMVKRCAYAIDTFDYDKFKLFKDIDTGCAMVHHDHSGTCIMHLARARFNVVGQASSQVTSS
jgi:hypothetical protein